MGTAVELSTRGHDWPRLQTHSGNGGNIVEFRTDWLRPSQRDRGAGTLEYIAALAVASTLITGVAFSSVKSEPGVMAQTAICRVSTALGVNLGCDPADEADPPEADEEAFDPKPDRCRIGQTTDQVSSVVKIGIIKFGEDAALVQTTYSDGSIDLTVTDGAGLGVESGVGARFRAGELEAGAKIDFGAGLEFDYGSTWTFSGDDAQAQADGVLEQINAYKLQQEQLSGQGAPGMALYLWLTDGYVDPPAPPNQSTATVEVDSEVGGQVGLVPPWDTTDRSKVQPGDVPNIDLANGGLRGGLSGVWTTVTDHDTGEVTYTTGGEAYGSYSVSAGGAEGLIGIDSEGRGLYGSDISITRNADGEITNVSFTTTRESSSGGEGTIGSDDANVSGGTSGADVEVVTTSLDVDQLSPEQQQLVEDWVYNDGIVTDDRMNPTDPVADDPFQNLLYSNAQVTTLQFDNVTDTTGFAAEVKLGLTLGVDFSLTQTDSTTVGATYLGAPGSDGSRADVEFSECLPG